MDDRSYLESELVQARTMIELLHAKHGAALGALQSVMRTIADAAGCDADMLSILNWIRSAKRKMEE